MRTLNLNFSGLIESLEFTCEMKSQAVKMTSQTEYARKAVYMVVHIQLIQQSFGLFPVLLKKKKTTT